VDHTETGFERRLEAHFDFAQSDRLDPHDAPKRVRALLQQTLRNEANRRSANPSSPRMLG
jgi:hypothetical protein